MCRRSLTLTAAPIALAMGLAACSGGGSPLAGQDSFAARLDLIPASVADPDAGDEATDDVSEGGEDDSSFPVMISMADLDRAAELAGIERPTDATDIDAVVEYLQRVSGFPIGDDDEPPAVAALFPAPAEITRLANGLEEFIDELGWSVLDVSWFVEQTTPPQVFTVMGGDFDEDRLTDAMGDPEGGMWRVGGEDHEADLNESTPARPLGLALTLALDDSNLIVSRLTPAVEDAIDGDTQTLADDPTLLALAQAFDDEDAYSALLVTGQSFAATQALADAGTTREREAARELIADDVILLEPFVGLGSGLALDDGEPFVVLAYAHVDDDTAGANADALRRLLEQGESLRTGQPWSEQLTVDAIRTDGSTVVARLGVAPETHHRLAYEIIVTRESLAVHG